MSQTKYHTNSYQPRVTLNHPVSTGGTTDDWQIGGDMAAYALVASRRKRRYYLLPSKVKRRTTPIVIFTVIPAVLFFLLYWAPIHLLWRLLFWLIACGILCGGIWSFMRRMEVSLQRFPLMKLDLDCKMVTFFRRKRLAYLQIAGARLRIDFADLVKVQMVETRKLENGRGGGFLTLLTRPYSALVLITRADGEEKKNVIFVNAGVLPFVNRTARKIAEAAGVPYEFIPSPPYATKVEGE